MIYLHVDFGDLLQLSKTLIPKLNKIAQEATRDLAIQTHSKIVEMASKELHSTRDKYMAALDIKQEGKNLWVISLDKSAIWIEDGKSEGEMIDDLLKSSKAKTAKDGSKYLAVPFQHNKAPTRQTPSQLNLSNTIRDTLKSMPMAELGKRQIPWGKIEKGANGKPLTGLLHKLDIMSAPTKTHEGVGQGKGQIGDVIQGITGIPYLQGIRIYQREVKDAKTGKSSIQREVMTFRIVSSKMKGSGRWVHPGLEAKNFFKKAADWAEKVFEDQIKPAILAKMMNEL